VRFLLGICRLIGSESVVLWVGIRRLMGRNLSSYRRWRPRIPWLTEVLKALKSRKSLKSPTSPKTLVDNFAHTSASGRQSLPLLSSIRP